MPSALTCSDPFDGLETTVTVLTSRSPSGSESLSVSENVTAVSNAVSALSLTALGDCSDPGGGGSCVPTCMVTVAVSSPPLPSDIL